MEDNIILTKSYVFAVKIVEVYKKLSKEKREFTLSKQVLRSGTSIGANAEEAVGGISKADFRAKMSNAYKEARETHYWLRLLHDSSYLDEKTFETLEADCKELLKILFSIIKNSGN